jgi:hypothetical protein
MVVKRGIRTPLRVLWALAALLLVAGAGHRIQADGGESRGLDASAPRVASPQAVDLGQARNDAMDASSPLQRVRSAFGVVMLLALAWLMSVDRGRIPWRLVIWGVALQVVFALAILKTPMGAEIFGWLNEGVLALLGFTVEGARFIFGDLVFNNLPIGTGDAGSNAPIVEIPGRTARAGA